MVQEFEGHSDTRLGSIFFNSQYPNTRNRGGFQKVVQVLKLGKGDRWQESTSSAKNNSRGHLKSQEPSQQDSGNTGRGKTHFSISEIQVPEGIGDREFDNKPYKLLVCEITLTVGSRGRTTAIDFPWKRNTSVSVFQDSTYREPC
jgi:hypothetical protein